MSEFKCVYVPMGIRTFHLESAKEQFDTSVKLLKSITDDVIVPDDILFSTDDIKAYLNGTNPSLIILQNTTFANAAYCYEVLKATTAPILLWTLREPVIDGTRLRLNSLTGAYSAGNAINEVRDTFEYVYGAPNEDDVIHQIRANINAAKTKYQLSNLNIAAIGNTPQGFGFGRAMDIDLVKYFSANLVSIEARELINKAKSFTNDECSEYYKKAIKSMNGLEDTPKENIDGFVRLYKAYAEFVKENNISALSSRCWPDFFTEYGTPVCAVLAMLNDMGVASSCESDVYGALSMYIGSQLTNSPTFFGDPVSLDESENTITYWHCGTAACSLARNNNPEVGVHPNRKIGPTMEFGCKPSEKATVFRIGKDKDGSFRFFVSAGEILDKPKQFCGTSIVFKPKNDAKSIVTNSVKNGFEPHFVVAYGDIMDELKILGNMLKIKICEY